MDKYSEYLHKMILVKTGNLSVVGMLFKIDNEKITIAHNLNGKTLKDKTEILNEKVGEITVVPEPFDIG